MHTRPHKLPKVDTQLLGVKRPKSGRWVSNSEENLSAILNSRPTFPSGGIDITDMISEFENEALVGFQEIFLLRFFHFFARKSEKTRSQKSFFDFRKNQNLALS